MSTFEIFRCIVMGGFQRFLGINSKIAKLLEIIWKQIDLLLLVSQSI